ncbi:uncharacterized protein LOC120255712 [Dioscorea cayenensis subsp. rotundata]|uniref:Uncharacterized protein LOC120255712 n=1 Tax=Dioscorea cayennensis subsp. rotundata TaxID=55577 RepID=A0AB40AWL3_DIOCR|nr:uncharacterized protein LOC120255712 [Dioscorea cayenensis subsp. rotundata]
MWKDPCIMDFPINLKPTYLNMDLFHDSMSLSDLLSLDCFNHDALIHTFGPNLDWAWLNNIDLTASQNYWIWGSTSLKTTLAFVVYDNLNSNMDVGWMGWFHIWRLRVIPSIKVLIWKLAHGKLLIGAYLYDINIGPHNLCNFCNLMPETATHVIWECPKVALYWSRVLSYLGCPTMPISVLSSEHWITSYLNKSHNSQFGKALIVTTAWLIWKERCNLIFKKWTPNFNSLVDKAWSYCSNFEQATRCMSRECPKLRNSKTVITIYSEASWDSSTQDCGLGFAIILNYNQILLAGSCGYLTDSPITAEIEAIILAMNYCANNYLNLNHIYCDCPGVYQMINNFQRTVAWRFGSSIHQLKLILKHFPSTTLQNIDCDTNILADSLAHFGL